MGLDYFLYMAESSGLDNVVSTRKAKVNAIIKDFVKYAEMGYDVNKDEFQDRIFKNHNLEDATAAEMMQIKREVERRI